MDKNLEIPEVAFIVRTTSNCTPAFQRQKLINLDANVMTLSSVALLLNCLSLFIFCQQRNRSAMRTSLILLSITESTFHTCNIGKLLLAQVPKVFTPAAFWQVALLSETTMVSYLAVDTFVSGRNWCNLIIATSRTEAIIWPLKRRKLFTRRRIVILLLIASAIALLLSFCRYFDYQLTVCRGHEGNVSLEPYLNPKTASILENLYFAWQSGIPCLTVVTCTLMMICILISNVNSDLPSSSVQWRRNQYFAIRTVLCLAIMFATFELPSLVISLGKYSNNPLLLHTGNTLVMLDSIFNFLVYSLSLPYFRSSVIGIFRCRMARVALPARMHTHPLKAGSRATGNRGPGPPCSNNHHQTRIILIETQI